jgi:O-antigen/teichoic acid export membrane protein
VGLVLTIPAAFALYGAAPFLCETIFGSEFAGAVDDLRVLALGAFGVVALQQLGNALTAQRRPGLATVAAAVAFTVTVVLDIALIPPHGGLGAALASTAAYCIGGLAVAMLFLREFGVPPRALLPRAKDVRRLADEVGRAVRRGRAAPDT